MHGPATDDQADRPVDLRKAEPSEAQTLTGLTYRSKAHWGYSEEFMRASAGELTVTPAYITANPTFVLDHDGVPVGFYSLERISASEIELGFLFVEPAHVGSRFGSVLIEHAKDKARRSGYARLVIQSDPHAEGFYLAVGARRIGSKESASLPGRWLPLFEIRLQ